MSLSVVSINEYIKTEMFRDNFHVRGNSLVRNVPSIYEPAGGNEPAGEIEYVLNPLDIMNPLEGNNYFTNRR